MLNDFYYRLATQTERFHSFRKLLERPDPADLQTEAGAGRRSYVTQEGYGCGPQIWQGLTMAWLQHKKLGG